MDQAINPYLAGEPIYDPEEFFGREEIVEWVTKELQLGTSMLALWGQRRIGKTSLLLQVTQTLSEQANFVPVYFDLQGQALRPLGEVLLDLIDTIINELDGVESPNLGENHDYDSFFVKFLPIFYKLVGNRELVLLLDEFDELDPLADSAVTTLFPFLFNLMTNHVKLRLVYATGRFVDDVTKPYFNETLTGALRKKNRHSKRYRSRKTRATGKA